VTAGLGLLLLLPGRADPAGAPRLRVGTSGDYAPFSTTGADGAPAGFDVAVARAYAADRGLELELVRFRWPQLLRDLEAGRFDVAMSGVTVRPLRSVAGRFSVPVVETGAVLLLREPGRWHGTGELDRPDVRIGVNAGGHLEGVARERFPRATLLSIANNAGVREALFAGKLDAAVTDTLEAPLWRRGREEEVEQTAPFTRDRKAYLVRADRPTLAEDLDRWLLERERDGSLARLRREHLSEETSPVATPAGALFAAIDERLSLMPLVAAAKRSAGLPLEVPEREALVLDAACEGARRAARRLGVEPLPDAGVRAVFAAQIEAARQVQAAALADPEPAAEPEVPDLESRLRPALLRIGERIATLLVSLPPDQDEAALRSAARDGLRTPGLSPDAAAAIAEAVAQRGRGRRPAAAGYAPPERRARAASPASTGITRLTP
jgi:cyclohexadienyl dehydratase